MRYILEYLPDDAKFALDTRYDYVEADSNDEAIFKAKIKRNNVVSVGEFVGSRGDGNIVYDKNCENGEEYVGWIVRRRPFAGNKSTRFITGSFDIDRKKCVDVISGDGQIGVRSDNYMIQKVKITIEPINDNPQKQLNGLK